MNAKEQQACAEGMRLPDGTLWPIPVCLGLADGAELDGELVALRSEAGEFLGVLEVDEVFERDRVAEAEMVYGTTDSEHPGVARVLSSPRRAVSGPIRAVVDTLAGPVGRYALTPEETRAAFAERGWSTVVGFQTRNPVHRAHEYLMKVALETCDGLLLHPLVGPTKEGDVPAEVRMRAYHAILEYFPPEDLGITPLRFDNAFFCRRCGGMATGKTCPHQPEDHLTLSGTQVRAKLTAGELPPPEFSRPEVAEILIAAYREQAS